MNSVKKSFQFGKHSVVIETGKIARQTTAAVTISMDDTVVLVTVVGHKEGSGGDFFPLTVDYQERTYAAGNIPGGYFKREGRPTEKETLTSRLIDRPIRPLFPDGFKNEVQVVATVLSMNPEVDPDIPAMIGTSAALCLSGLPFNGPIAAARVGYLDGQYLLNPSHADLVTSQLDLVVAGTKDAVLMVESEAKELSEEVMLGAVLYGHQQMQVAIAAINELAAEAGNARWDWQAPEENVDLANKVKALISEDLAAAYQIQEKLQRYGKVDELRQKAISELSVEGSETLPSAEEVAAQFAKVEKAIVRERILQGAPRIDGRDLKTVRPITIETGLLPRTHGSALFTRGETQAIVVATLGTGRDAQIIDALTGEHKDTFMLHYNFPPYCVGETGRVGAPKRREIGHGKLAKRAIAAVIPKEEDFPYVASVCGTSLALMDAGVPIKAPVAGIAMGLVKEGGRFAVLTDILGDEDHLGDMDFKVAGTAAGVTALQMDIKIEGINKAIIEIALQQAKDGRMHILGVMNQVIASPREEMSDYAPRIVTMTVDTDKIRDVIGKGGATIRGLIEETGVSIDINDDGVVSIASSDNAAAQKAIERIKAIVADVEVGKIYTGKVNKIVDFGAFVNILPGKDGLVHISQIAAERIERVEDYLQEGQEVTVKVLEIDRQGRVRLSIRAAEEELAGTHS